MLSLHTMEPGMCASDRLCSSGPHDASVSVRVDPREISHPAPPTLIFADFKGLAATAIVYLAHDV